MASFLHYLIHTFHTKDLEDALNIIRLQTNTTKDDILITVVIGSYECLLLSMAQRSSSALEKSLCKNEELLFW